MVIEYTPYISIQISQTMLVFAYKVPKGTYTFLVPALTFLLGLPDKLVHIVTFIPKKDWALST